MARQHAQIVTAIWADPDFLALTGGAQRMFMALLTQPKITMVGSLDYIPKRWAAQAADLSVDDIEAAIAELESARFVLVDRDVDELVIRTFVKGDGSAKSGPQRGAMWSAWSALASDRLRREIIAELPDEAWEGPDTKGRGAAPVLAEALHDAPSDAPSDGLEDDPRYYQSLNREPGTGNQTPSGLADAEPSPPDGAAPSIKSDPDLINELCDMLADRIETHRDGQRPKITQAWRRDLDLLLRRGPTDVDPPTEITPEKLRSSINALFDRLSTRDPSGFCWADQVQSPAALRKHWTRLGQALRAQSSTKASGDELLAKALDLKAAREARQRSPLSEAFGG